MECWLLVVLSVVWVSCVSCVVGCGDLVGFVVRWLVVSIVFWDFSLVVLVVCVIVVVGYVVFVSWCITCVVAWLFWICWLFCFVWLIVLADCW